MADQTDDSPRARRRRPPLLSVVIAAGCVYLLFELREETVFFFQPRTPADLGVVGPTTRLSHNRHVRVQGIPDRTRTVLLDGRFGRHRAIFRLHGTRSKVFVAQPRKHRMPPDVFSDAFEGRLLRLADQPYFPGLYRYFADNLRTSVDLPVSELVRVAGRSPSDVRDIDGRPFRLKAEDDLFISVAFPGEYRVQFDRMRYPEPKESDGIASSLGLPWGPLEDSRAFRSYVVQADAAGAARLMGQFSDPVRKIGVLPRTAAIRVRWSDVRVVDGALQLAALDAPGPTAYAASQDGLLVPEPVQPTLLVPPDRVRSAEAQTPLIIPMDAMILHEGDSPNVYWYVAAADLALLALLAFNVALLLRRRREAGAAEVAHD